MSKYANVEAQIAPLKFSKREQETLASDYANTAKGLRVLLAQAAKREEVLVNALQCIVRELDGCGISPAHQIARKTLKKLGL